MFQGVRDINLSMQYGTPGPTAVAFRAWSSQFKIQVVGCFTRDGGVHIESVRGTFPKPSIMRRFFFTLADKCYKKVAYWNA